MEQKYNDNWINIDEAAEYLVQRCINNSELNC